MDIPQNISTYRRGTSQIDYVMCSPRISSFIRFIHLQDYGTICTSDHKSFIMDLDFNQWVGCSIEAAKEQRKRIISSIQPKKISAYKQKVLEYMGTTTAQHNIKKLKENLHSKDNNISVQQHLNQLDEEFLQSRLRAESELGVQ